MDSSDLEPYLIMLLGTTSASPKNDISIGSAVLRTPLQMVTKLFNGSVGQPQKLSLSLAPHLIYGSLGGPPDPTQLPKRFSRFHEADKRDRQTKARHTVCSNRPLSLTITLRCGLVIIATRYLFHISSAAQYINELIKYKCIECGSINDDMNVS